MIIYIIGNKLVELHEVARNNLFQYTHIYNIRITVVHRGLSRNYTFYRTYKYVCVCVLCG